MVILHSFSIKCISVGTLQHFTNCILCCIIQVVEEEAAVVEGVSVEAVEEIAEDEVEGLIEAEVGVVLTEAVVVLTEVAAVFEDSGDLL